MREFREIEDVEKKLRVSERKRMTPEEASEFVRKFDKSFEESMVEKDQVSSETEFERTKREIREYIDAEEKSKELMDEIIRTDSIDIEPIEKTESNSINTIPKEIDNAEVYRLYYKEKLSQRRIAEVLGFSRDEIRKHFKTQGLKPRSVGAAEKEIDHREVHRICVEEGRPKNEAAEILGCASIRPINRILKENDWKTPLEVKMETEIDPDEVHRLHYDEGWSYIRIANHYGYESKDIISKLFDERDWIPTPLAKRVVYEFPSEIEEEHRIESSRTNDVFEHLGELEDVSPLDMDRCIENLMLSSSSESGVEWVEVASQSKWATRATEVLSENLNQVETSLNELLGFSEDSKMKIRVGFVDEKLYIRHQDVSEYNWMNIYDNELFYFNSTVDKFKLIHEMRARLGLTTNTDLGRLIDQLTDRESGNGNGYSDIKECQDEHVRAETLHLILDTTGRELSDVRERIHCIGKIRGGTYEGKGGIRNPRFPTDPETIDIMFAKFFGLGLSDGHIQPDHSSFIYAEKNPDRREIVIQHSKDFGDVYYNEKEVDGEIRQIQFAGVFGRALERRGFTVGDKAMQNMGLPSFIGNGSPEVKYAYFSNLWPEDGNFHMEEVNNNRGRFRWDCSIVLSDPGKEEEYCHRTEVTAEHMELIQRFGKHREEDVKNGFSASIELTAAALKKLIQHKNPNLSSLAQSLKDIVYRNSCNRLFDEIDALGSIGVCATPYFRKLTLQKETSRLSTGWVGEIGKKIDVMRTALFMPPDDFVKKAKVEKWIRLNPDMRGIVEGEIAKSKTREE